MGGIDAKGAGSKLPWPPTEEDLRHLYVDEKRSAANIAALYGLKTKNPRSAPYLITYHLKKKGIQRRNRVAELTKASSAAVAEWSSKYPSSKSIPVEPEQEAEFVMELLRIPGLSIKHLDECTKLRVRDTIQYLHHEHGVSLTDISEMIGNKTSGYASWMARQLGVQPREFEQARLKGIHEKVRKYQRKPFDGTDEDKAYMLGLKHGDLYAYTPFGDAVRVSTSTTHPALAELFTNLFSPHGHVYKHPRFKNDTNTYEWNLEVILDQGFGFLLESREKCRYWVTLNESTILAYLAGLVDAEGHIRIYPNPRTVGLSLAIYNTDIDLIRFAYACLGRLGCKPVRPYLEKKRGYVSAGFRILLRKDYWRVLLARFDEVQTLLWKLPLRHREKCEMRQIALSIQRGVLYQDVADKISSLKECYKEEVRQSTNQAEQEFRRKHIEQR
jgi:hypothetical protein